MLSLVFKVQCLFLWKEGWVGLRDWSLVMGKGATEIKRPASELLDSLLCPPGPGGPTAKGTGGPSVFFVTTLLIKCMSISVTLSDYAFPFQC